MDDKKRNKKYSQLKKKYSDAIANLTETREFSLLFDKWEHGEIEDYPETAHRSYCDAIAQLPEKKALTEFEKEHFNGR
jgi:hypothetical protein